MEISKSLVKQFAKLTAQQDSKKDSVTVYGYVRKSENSDQAYVMLDGSTTYTPVQSTVMAVDGARVLVQIKNHVATIIGSTSDLAANSDLVDQKDVIAVNGMIDNLKTNNVLAETIVTNAITAEDGTIENLITGTLTSNEVFSKTIVTNSLTADDGTIKNLITGKLTGDEVFVKNVVANALKADDADIKQLVVDNIEAGSINGYQIKNSYILAKALSNEAIETLVGSNITYSAIEPTDPKENDLWYKTIVAEDESTTEILYTYQDGSWVLANLDYDFFKANCITAREIYVEDLYALGATIGGFDINETSISHNVIDTSTHDYVEMYYVERIELMDIDSLESKYVGYSDHIMSNTSVYLGEKGIEIGTNFKVSNEGRMEALSGTIGCFTIQQTKGINNVGFSIYDSNGNYISYDAQNKIYVNRNENYIQFNSNEYGFGITRYKIDTDYTFSFDYIYKCAHYQTGTLFGDDFTDPKQYFNVGIGEIYDSIVQYDIKCDWPEDDDREYPVITTETKNITFIFNQVKGASEPSVNTKTHTFSIPTTGYGYYVIKIYGDNIAGQQLSNISLFNAATGSITYNCSYLNENDDSVYIGSNGIGIGTGILLKDKYVKVSDSQHNLYIDLNNDYLTWGLTANVSDSSFNYFCGMLAYLYGNKECGRVTIGFGPAEIIWDNNNYKTVDDGFIQYVNTDIYAGSQCTIYCSEPTSDMSYTFDEYSIKLDSSTLSINADIIGSKTSKISGDAYFYSTIQLDTTSAYKNAWLYLTSSAGHDAAVHHQSGSGTFYLTGLISDGNYAIWKGDVGAIAKFAKALNTGGWTWELYNSHSNTNQPPVMVYSGLRPISLNWGGSNLQAYIDNTSWWVITGAWSSDRRLKKDIKNVNDTFDVESFYMDLSPKEFRYLNYGGMGSDEDETLHTGLIAQDVRDLYSKHGMDPENMNLLKKNKIPETNNEAVKSLLGNDEYYYTMNYENLHAYHIYMIQKLQNRIKELEEVVYANNN